MWMSCPSKKLSSFMGFQKLSYLIGIRSSLLIFREHYGGKWGLVYNLAALSLPNGWPERGSNWSLGNLLRSLVGENKRQWDLTLSQAEFAYNCLKNRSAGKSPFEVVYGQIPNSPLDLAPLPITN